MGQTDGQVGEPGHGRGGLRVVEHDLAAHRSALVLVRVIHAVDPVVGPLRGFLFGLGEGVLIQGVGIVRPRGRDRRVAGGGGQGFQVRRRRLLGIGHGIDIDKNRADDLVPFLPGGNVAARAAVVMAAFPIIQNDRVRVVIVAVMAVQFQLGRTAAEIFDSGVDEPDADVILGAGPAVGGGLVLDAGVAVFVLDGILVRPGVHDPLFFRVDDHAVAPVLRRALEHVAVGIHGDPVEGLADLGDVTALRATPPAR